MDFVATNVDYSSSAAKKQDALASKPHKIFRIKKAIGIGTRCNDGSLGDDRWPHQQMLLRINAQSQRCGARHTIEPGCWKAGLAIGYSKANASFGGSINVQQFRLRKIAPQPIQ